MHAISVLKRVLQVHGAARGAGTFREEADFSLGPFKNSRHTYETIN